MAVMGVCPGCGCKFPLEAALQDARARQALAGALKLDARLADPLLSYLGLFSSTDGRACRMDKLVRLIAELAEPIAAATVTRNKMTYAAPVDYWKQGLEEVLGRRDKLTLPLKSHGYLFEVVLGIASKAAGVVEQKTEQAARNKPRNRSGMQAVAAVVDPAAREAKRQEVIGGMKATLNKGKQFNE